jgi:hypothetical protein
VSRISRKRDPEFMQMLKEHISADVSVGKLIFTNLYASICVNIRWKNHVIPIPYSHLMWFVTKGEWPKDGYHLDHKNDDPTDNRPDNLQEVIEAENHKKRRGRLVYRSYGKGKYGYGMGVHQDKRDGRYYVDRHLSRGHGNGELKTPRISYGGYDTLPEAEAKVAECIAEIEKKGLAHVPDLVEKKPKKSTTAMNAELGRMRELRLAGKTIQEIADITGFTTIAVYNRVKDLKVDNRRGAAHGGVKLTEGNVREIRKLAAEGATLRSLAQKFNVSAAMISQIVKRQAWAHVE